MPARPSPLWSSPAFRALWGSDTISLLGLHTTLLALPLTAIGLGATPVQVGLLTTAQTAPALLFGLFAGALVDRYRRRSLLLAANLARAALLASLPLAAALGRLHLAQLYLIAFLSGVAALVFVVAYQAFLPTVVPRAHLLVGNGALRAREATAQAAGPGLGGLLVQLLGAPLAVGMGAVAALGSALAVLAIRTPEPHPRADGAGPGIGRAIGAGFRFVLAHPTLRPVVLAATLGAICGGMGTSLALLYAVRDLGISAATLGVIVGAGGLSALPAALLARRIIRRYGLGPTLIATTALAGGAAFLLPLADGPTPGVLALLLAWRILADPGGRGGDARRDRPLHPGADSPAAGPRGTGAGHRARLRLGSARPGRGRGGRAGPGARATFHARPGRVRPAADAARAPRRARSYPPQPCVTASPSARRGFRRSSSCKLSPRCGAAAPGGSGAGRPTAARAWRGRGRCGPPPSRSPRRG